jgi:hypothetical protein
LSEVAAAFFSFTEVTRADEHRAYNEWHQLDHLPEQYTLPGIVWGERWVSTPDCRAARAASGPLLDPVHYLTTYLVAPPLDVSLEAFARFGQELRELGRFHEHRRPHLTGAHDIVATAAAPRVLVSAASVPFRPNRGVHVRVEAGTDDVAIADRVHELIEVPGVAGAWAFRRRPAPRDERFPEPPDVVTVAWLDGPPLAVAAAIAARVTGPGDPLFEGPFERIEVGRWDWFETAGSTT